MALEPSRGPVSQRTGTWDLSDPRQEANEVTRKLASLLASRDPKTDSFFGCGPTTVNNPRTVNIIPNAKQASKRPRRTLTAGVSVAFGGPLSNRVMSSTDPAVSRPTINCKQCDARLVSLDWLKTDSTQITTQMTTQLVLVAGTSTC